MGEYIKRKDAFEILQSRLDNISQMSYLDMDWHELDIMRNAIENAIDDIREVPAAGVQPTKWVSVEDRLPDKSCECLGIVDGEVTEVSYSPKCKELICVWSMCDADGSKPLPDDAVTHWMPLPEPPKEDDAE